MSLRQFCEEATLPQLHSLPESVLAGLIETYMARYPEKALGQYHLGVLYCSYPWSTTDFLPESFYRAVLRILEQLEKANHKIQELLMPKIRHHILYVQLYQRLEKELEKEKELELPQPQIVDEFDYFLVESEMQQYAKDGICPSLHATVTLLRECIDQGLCQTNIGSYDQIFGMGFSLKQSTAFISILHAAGEMTGLDGSSFPIKDMFNIESIARGSYVTIQYSYNGFGIVLIDLVSNYGRGLDSGVDSMHERIYTYRFI